MFARLWGSSVANITKYTNEQFADAESTENNTVKQFLTKK